MEVDRERCVRNRGGDDAGVTTRDGWMDASCASLGLRGSTTGRGGARRGRASSGSRRGGGSIAMESIGSCARFLGFASRSTRTGGRERVDEDVGVVRVIARAGVDDDDDGGGLR